MQKIKIINDKKTFLGEQKSIYRSMQGLSKLKTALINLMKAKVLQITC